MGSLALLFSPALSIPRRRHSSSLSITHPLVPQLNSHFVSPQSAAEQERVREHRRRLADRVVDERSG